MDHGEKVFVNGGRLGSAKGIVSNLQQILYMINSSTLKCEEKDQTIVKKEEKTLDAYVQERIDTDERFVNFLKRGFQETKTGEESINILMKEVGGFPLAMCNYTQSTFKPLLSRFGQGS